ncbi:hypothetical protein [Paludibaculum fermentans]|uniref:Uncharacterized protein n=1 Tax=Paludibaculum fermentans TaxID=1473598 RepID=A0A7S7NR05_PALFE|nr:hypothetical protein [Paludibaculum fermentans]QOY88114.1 hypothetical protein IRI77_36160 [Paludibaculum fermentans]
MHPCAADSLVSTLENDLRRRRVIPADSFGVAQDHRSTEKRGRPWGAAVADGDPGPG